MSKQIKQLSLNETTKLIKSIRGRSRTVVLDIHIAALSSLVHAQEHGNFTLMTQLYSAVSNGHKTGLVLYFRSFGPVNFVKKDKAFRKDKTTNAKPWDIKGATETSPDDLDRELHVKQTQFDAAKLMQQVKRYIEKRAEVAKENGDSTTSDKLAKAAESLAA